MAKNHRYFILAGLSGLLLALAYPGWSFNLGFLAWIGFIPLIYCLNAHKNCFWAGFMVGLVYFLIIFRWLWSVYPLDTLGIQSKLASLIIIFIVYIFKNISDFFHYNKYLRPRQE